MWGSTCGKKYIEKTLWPMTFTLGKVIHTFICLKLNKLVGGLRKIKQFTFSWVKNVFNRIRTNNLIIF